MDRRRDTFSEYVAARRPQIYRAAYLLCQDPHHAEDLVQTTLTRLYVAWPRVERMASVDAYVRRMLMNARTDASRRPWRRERPGLDPQERPAPSSDVDLQQDLLDALRRLAPGQRRVVVLRHVWGLSVAETAAELGVSPGTVKSQTSAALEHLRHHLTTASTGGAQ